MLVVMQADATDAQVDAVCTKIAARGLRAHPIPGRMRTAVGITGNTGAEDPGEFSILPGVSEVIRVTKPYKLASREVKPEDTVVRIDGADIGGPEPIVMAGPCSVESLELMLESGFAVKSLGAHVLRGGAFKPRTSPYSFQGLGLAGIEILAHVRREVGLPVITEATTVAAFDPVEEVADIVQIGARNMQNYDLLRRAGESFRPVLLKRGMSATIDELLLAAEYIISEGNRNVILCERGIRTFSGHTRFTLDLGIVPVLRSATHLPVIVDPSHAAGRRDIVPALARAAIAAGAHGVLVEVHPDPDHALSDGAQSLTVEMFAQLMKDLDRLAPALSHAEASCA